MSTQLKCPRDNALPTCTAPQGKVDPARRNYVAIFREMAEHKAELLVGLSLHACWGARLQLPPAALAALACTCSGPARPPALLLLPPPAHAPGCASPNLPVHGACPCAPPLPAQARNFSLVILGKGGGRRDSSIVQARCWAAGGWGGLGGWGCALGSSRQQAAGSSRRLLLHRPL